MSRSKFTEILLLTQINFGRSWPKKNKTKNSLLKVNARKFCLSKKLQVYFYFSPKEQVIPWW